MQELSATVTTLAGSANALKDIAEKLNEDMKFFKDWNWFLEYDKFPPLGIKSAMRREFFWTKKIKTKLSGYWLSARKSI